MKKILLLLFVVSIPMLVHAQEYKFGSPNSSWDDHITSGIRYLANVDDVGKGSFGYEMNTFNSFGKSIGMSLAIDGIYSLASKKFFDVWNVSVGPNYSYPLNEKFILYAPLYVSIAQWYGSDKIHVGAVLVPSVGFRLGGLFLSAGWNFSYSFTASEDNFSAKNFNVSISGITKF